MTSRARPIAFLLLALLAGALAAPLRAAEVARADLPIVGLALEVDTSHAIATAVDIPTSVQTIFGRKTTDDAPPAPGMVAQAELTGPGIDAPITLTTQPGHAFAIPALHTKGDYALQNIRLAGTDGTFLQPAVPSFVGITVS